MIVCSCNALSDGQVRDVAAEAQGRVTPDKVYKCLGCSPDCGRCVRTIRALIAEVKLCSSTCAGCPLTHDHEAAPLLTEAA